MCVHEDDALHNRERYCIIWVHHIKKHAKPAPTKAYKFNVHVHRMRKLEAGSIEVESLGTKTTGVG